MASFYSAKLFFLFVVFVFTSGASNFICFPRIEAKSFLHPYSFVSFINTFIGDILGLLPHTWASFYNFKSFSHCTQSILVIKISCSVMEQNVKLKKSVKLNATLLTTNRFLTAISQFVIALCNFAVTELIHLVFLSKTYHQNIFLYCWIKSAKLALVSKKVLPSLKCKNGSWTSMSLTPLQASIIQLHK